MSARSDEVSTKLDASRHASIFNDQILPASGFTEAVSKSPGSSDPPRAIILAGQPGAGKGNLTRAANAEFESRGGAVSVDPDELRGFHPNVDSFRLQKPYTWADDTHPDASQWAKELREKAKDEHKNLILDTTLGDPAKAVELVKSLQKEGYQVEIRAMAVHQLESELGVDKRFSDGLEREGFGRYVPQKVRDQVYNDLPGVLDTVKRETSGVPISIYDRGSFQVGREPTPVYSSRDVHDSRAPSAVMSEAREARVKDPGVVSELSKGWHQQEAWHKDLADKLPTYAKVKEGAREPLMAELGREGVAAAVSKNVEKIDALSKSLTTPSPSPTPSHSSSDLLARVQHTVEALQSGRSTGVSDLAHSPTAHQMQSQARTTVDLTQQQTSPQHGSSGQSAQQQSGPTVTPTTTEQGGRHK